MGTEVQQAERKKDPCSMPRLALWSFTVNGAFVDHGPGKERSKEKHACKEEQKRKGWTSVVLPLVKESK